MPREFRKRGKRKPKSGQESNEYQKYREVQAPASAADIEYDEQVANEHEAEFADPQTSGNGVEGGKQWPQLSEDVKAYWRGIDERIRELESLAGPSQLEDEDSDASLLLRNALESLSSSDASSELALATDPETSLILERLLHSMNDFSRRVLVDRFAGNYVDLSCDRYASHVLETMFAVAWNTVARESSSLLVPRKEEVDSMTDLISLVTIEIAQDLERVAKDPFGSHVLKTLVLLLMGKVGEGKTERSKKSERFRKKHVGHIKGLGGEEEGKGKERQVQVPEEWKASGASVINKARSWGKDLRELSFQEAGCVVVQVLVELEHDLQMFEDEGSILLCLLDQSTRSSYLADVLRSDGPSHVAEAIFTCCPSSLFLDVWKHDLLPSLSRLLKHPIANYPLIQAIGCLDEQGLKEVLDALDKDGGMLADMVDTKRLGCVRTLGERLAKIGYREGEKKWVAVIEKAFKGDGTWKEGELVACIMGLTRLELYRKLPMETRDRIETQGALLLQTWLILPPPSNELIIKSLLSLSPQRIIDLAQSPISSRVLDVLLESNAVPPKDKRTSIRLLIGHYHTLADSKIGSRVAENCWAVADTFMKEKIVQSLTEHTSFLHASQFGHFLAKKINIPLYLRNRQSWIEAMAAADRLQKRETQVDGDEMQKDQGKKKRERDEIDVLFQEVKKKKRKG
ncbi:ARM repeat-containing protein [Atractiella rhizophila]|nr:ARM repeat-containing protein [Atractiella rhizophila]